MKCVTSILIEMLIYVAIYIKKKKKIKKEIDINRTSIKFQHVIAMLVFLILLFL
jgi:hypothetical protein